MNLKNHNDQWCVSMENMENVWTTINCTKLFQVFVFDENPCVNIACHLKYCMVYVILSKDIENENQSNRLWLFHFTPHATKNENNRFVHHGTHESIMTMKS